MQPSCSLTLTENENKSLTIFNLVLCVLSSAFNGMCTKWHFSERNKRIGRKSYLHEAGDSKDNITHAEELNYLKAKQINAYALIVCW